VVLHGCRRERVTASGGEVGRLSIFGGAEVRSFYFLFFLFQKKKKFYNSILMALTLNTFFPPVMFICYFTLSNM
jgi:hypothetical protein